MQFRNILYVSQDPAREQASLAQALRLAREQNATLRAVILHAPLGKALQQHEAGFANYLRDQLQRSIDGLRAQPALSVEDLSIEVLAGKAPALRLVQQVLRHRHDLLLKQSERGTQRGFRALDMTLLRECPCPVWLTRSPAKARTQQRIAVAIDPDAASAVERQLSIELLHTANALAVHSDSVLDVIGCWAHEVEDFIRHSVWSEASEGEIMQVAASLRHQSRRTLDELVREAGVGPAQLHHLRGRPDERIPEFLASHPADVLVMGTLARTGIPGFVIGNTAENILQTINCSLLALKPPGFVSPLANES